MSLAKVMVHDGLQTRNVAAGDVIAGAELIGTLTTVGAGALTGALLFNSLLRRSGPTDVFTDTTGTAAEIIAAISGGAGTTGLDQDTTWRLTYQNTTGFTATLAAGTNVTLSGATAIPPLSEREFLIKITNGTPTQVYAATTTNSSKVMTGLTQAQTSQLSVGMAVSGTGIAASSTIASVQPGTGVTLNNNMTATATNIAITFAPTVSITAITQAISLPSYKYVAVTANTSTLVAGDITGATEVVLNTSTQATPTFTTRTAAQMIADIPNAQIGMTWKVTVLNRNSGTLTMAAGSGVTITGTATIATVNWKDFICTYTAADTIVMQVGASGAL